MESLQVILPNLYRTWIVGFDGDFLKPRGLIYQKIVGFFP